MHLNYQPFDDTPEKVEAAIQKYQDLSALDRTTETYARAYARTMMEQADALVRWGELDPAEQLALRAARLNIAYSPFEQKPRELLERIANLRRQRAPRAGGGPASAGRSGGSPADAGFAMAASDDDRQARPAAPAGVIQAGGQYPAANGGPDRNAAAAVYDPSADPTRNIPAASQEAGGPNFWMAQNAGQPGGNGPAAAQASDAPGGATPPPNPGDGRQQTPGMALFQRGEEALRAHDGARAYDFFRQAANYPSDFDSVTWQRLQDHLQMLSAGRANPATGSQPGCWPTRRPPGNNCWPGRSPRNWPKAYRTPLPCASTIRSGPWPCWRTRGGRSRPPVWTRPSGTSFCARVGRTIYETQQLIAQNGPQIELAEKNNRIRDEVVRELRTKVEVQEKIAMLIDKFNRYRDEQRFEEAEVVAKQAAELDPNNPVVVQVLWDAKFIQRDHWAKDIRDKTEEGVVIALGNSEQSAIPMDDNRPYQFGGAKTWSELTASRKKFSGDRRRQQTEREIELEKKLRMPVPSLQFTNAKLNDVVGYLARVAGVNLYLDPQGLAEEGVTSDTPVTINLQNEIMLKSALNLILEPLHLSYVIKDEVLRITSEQMRDNQVYTVTYSVADLVIPIPNFVPTPMGLQAAYDKAMADVGMGGTGQFGSPATAPLTMVVGRDSKPVAGATSPALLAQVSSASHPGATAGAKSVPPSAAGPGGLGGGSQADFDALIDLITSTIRPTSWEDVGGPGSIKPFETNLSIVVSQTQEVHEEIVDLLEQLRRLQDLQVTIEVRFITLNDNFAEQIGVNFDFDIKDNLFGKTQFGGRQCAERRDHQQQRFFLDGGHRHSQQHPDGRQHQRHGHRGPGLDQPQRLHGRPGRPLYPRRGLLGHTAVRRAGPDGRGDDGLRHPQRRGGVFFHHRRPKRQTQPRAASPQGHAVQRATSHRPGRVLQPLCDQRDPGRRRLRRRPRAGDRYPYRRHLHDRSGRRFQRSAVRADDGRALLQQHRRREHLRVHRLHHDHQQ